MAFREKFKSFCIYIITPCVAITSLALWPFVLLVVIINELWRTFLHNIVLRRRYKLIQHTAGHFHMSKYFNGRMVLLALYSEDVETAVDIHQEQEIFRDRVFQKSSTSRGHPELKMTFVIKHGYPWFRDDSEDSFDVSNHVKFFDACVPINDDGIFTEKELVQEIFPNHLSQNMDESKPQWEWLVFPRIRRENGSINSLRIFRWDHRYMDGASAAVLLAEYIFDKWTTPFPPYFRNPKVPPSPSQRRWETLAQFWAWLHLPIILLGIRLSKIFVKGDGSRPFATYNNKGLTSFSTSWALERQLVRERMTKNGNSSVASALASFLGPALYGIFKFRGSGGEPVEPVLVASLMALPPYRTPLVNKYTILSTPVPLSSSVQLCEFEMNLQMYIVNVIGRFFGRLSIPWINLLSGPVPSSVCLNSMPFLRKCGSIQGKVIHEMASWSFLISPVGLQLTALGYGEKLFLTGHSVEGCCDHQQIENLVRDYTASFDYSHD